jgi:hypothetical protein
VTPGCDLWDGCCSWGRPHTRTALPKPHFGRHGGIQVWRRSHPPLQPHSSQGGPSDPVRLVGFAPLARPRHSAPGRPRCWRVHLRSGPAKSERKCRQWEVVELVVSAPADSQLSEGDSEAGDPQRTAESRTNPAVARHRRALESEPQTHAPSGRRAPAPRKPAARGLVGAGRAVIPRAGSGESESWRDMAG